MRPIGRTIAVAAILLGVRLAGAPASAEEPASWHVDHKLFGKFDEKKLKFDKAKDVSGIACMEDAGFPRHCLIIDDDVTRAQIVVLTEGHVVAGECINPGGSGIISPDQESLAPGCVKLIDGNVSLDGEGVTFVAEKAGGGTFYVLGSHGVSRKGKVPDDVALKASSNLGSIPVKQGQISDAGTATPALSAAPAIDLHPAFKQIAGLAPFVDHRLGAHGLTAEGVLVRNGFVYAGLRAPVLNGEAIIVVAPLNDLAAAKALPIALGMDRGIRDLASYKDETTQGLLVLAGPSLDPDEKDPILPTDYSLFFIPGDLSKPDGLYLDKLKRLGDLQGFSHTNDENEIKAEKPEAILPLDIQNGSLRVLVLYDGAVEGSPRSVLLPRP